MKKNNKELWPSERQIKAANKIDEMKNILLEAMSDLKQVVEKNTIPIGTSKAKN